MPDEPVKEEPPPSEKPDLRGIKGENMTAARIDAEKRERSLRDNRKELNTLTHLSLPGPLTFYPVQDRRIRPVPRMNFTSRLI